MTKDWKSAQWFAWVLWGMIVVATTMAILTIPGISTVITASILLVALAVWLAPIAFSGWNW